MKTQVFRLDEISPAEYNPRQDLKPGDKQYEAIRHSIEAYGFVEPLVVNVRDGKNVLVGGHQRYKILTRQGSKRPRPSWLTWTRSKSGRSILP